MQDGYDNWNDYVSAKSDAELEAEDEEFSRDFEYLLQNRFNHVWGDEESEEEEDEDDYAYMHNNIDDGDDAFQMDEDDLGEGGDGVDLRRTVDLGATLRRGRFPQNLVAAEDEEDEAEVGEVDEELDVHEATDDDWG